MQRHLQIKYHLLALFTVLVWGTTFVSTKILLKHDMNPSSIFFCRFLLAFFLISFFSKDLFCKFFPWKDELKMLCLGFFGGSFYFLTENTALYYTLSTNVSFILCSAPLFTAILIASFSRKLKQTFSSKFIVGSTLSVIGVATVIFSGHFILQLSLKGDLLCLLSALSWGFYTLFLKDLEQRYSSLLLTKKVFFYGLLSIIPYMLINKTYILPKEIWSDGVVWGNLLFLGVIASMLCYLSWNVAVKHLGAIKATNYIYLSPIFTSIASAIFLQESITIGSILGAILIISGVWTAFNGFPSRIIPKIQARK